MQGRWVAIALLSLFCARIASAATPPKLVVVIIVDQLGSNYLTRYGAHLRGGFRRLEKKGAYYPNGVHAIANTATGPGHANIATGAWPDLHGIVSNKWIEPGTGREIYCTEDPAHGVGPANLAVPSFADAMKDASRGRSRVIAVSGKDRSAILLGGRKPDVVAWYDEASGQFVSGRHQAMKAPAWLGAVNLELSAAPVFGRTWDRFRKDLDYAKISTIDDSPFEEEAPGIGRRFPRTLGQGLPGPGAAWFESYPYTPAAAEALFALARSAFDAEKLGRGPAPDLLAVAVSSLDWVGHSYGPESQEAFDTLLRIDAEIESLMKHVDTQLGAEATLWVVSSDHGVTPTPERTESESGFGRRLDKHALEAAIDRAFTEHPDRSLRGVRVQLLYGPDLFLSPGGTPEARARAARAAAEIAALQPGVAEAYAAEDIARFSPTLRAHFERLVFPRRTPDVFVRFEPGIVVAKQPHGSGAGANHGSPYGPDANVPIFIAGPGVRREIDRRPVHVTRIAPSITAVLKIDPPAAALEAPLPATLPD